MHAFTPDADGYDCAMCPLPANHPSHTKNPDPVAPTTDGPRRGDTYVHNLDHVRLNAQARRVYDAMGDGRWRTLADVATQTHDPEASVSARLRDFRKPEFGALTVERRRRADGSGVWEYRITKTLSAVGATA